MKSKGKEIEYGQELMMQPYLQSNSLLTFQEQIDIFAYRTRMNLLTYNFPNKNSQIQKCKCGEQITNEHLLDCDMLNNGRKYDLKYQQIFNGTIQEQKSILNVLQKNLKIVEISTQAS